MAAPMGRYALLAGVGQLLACCWPCRVWWAQLVRCLVWFFFRETARVGTRVPEEAEAHPLLFYPSPLGYCLCVSCAMDRWLS